MKANRRTLFLVVGALLVSAAGPLAAEPASQPGSADWPQFRGPNRDGIVPGCPKLLDAWPTSGPDLLWHSEWTDRPCDKGRDSRDSGCSSPVVADGKVFVYANIKAPKDGGMRFKPLSKEVLINAGWLPDLPDDLAKKFEAARVARPDSKKAPAGAPLWFAITPPSDAEIDAFLAKTPELDTYIKGFVATLDPKDATKYGAYIKRRFTMFYSELTWDELVKLSKMQDREVEHMFELGEGRESIMGYYRNPRDDHGSFCMNALLRNSKVTDTVVCMDAATGKTVWKKDFPVDMAVFDRKDISICYSPYGAFDYIGVSSVPTVWQGKIYVQGFMGIYCLSTKDGSLVWKVPTDPEHSSPLVADGIVYNCGVAYNAEDGAVLWKNPNYKPNRKDWYKCAWSSPMLWSSGGTNYVITQDGQKNCVLELKTGKMAWALAPSQFVGGSWTAVVDGDVLISANTHGGGTDLIAVKLTPAGVEPMWSRKDTGGAYCPLVWQGHVYCFGEGRGGSSWRCLDLKTGEDAWVEKVPKGGDPTSTPVLADGKIINVWGETHYTSASGYEMVELVKATPEKCVRLGLAKFSLKIVGMSSPAVADGKLFFRLQDGGVACYDLAAK